MTTLSNLIYRLHMFVKSCLLPVITKNHTITVIRSLITVERNTVYTITAQPSILSCFVLYVRVSLLYTGGGLRGAPVLAIYLKGFNTT